MLILGEALLNFGLHIMFIDEVIGFINFSLAYLHFHVSLAQICQSIWF